MAKKKKKNPNYPPNNNRRGNNKRPNNNNNKNQGQKAPKFLNNDRVIRDIEFTGVLEMSPNGYGFVRRLDYEFTATENDPFVHPEMIKQLELRPGSELFGLFDEDQNGSRKVIAIMEINGLAPIEWQKKNRFEFQTPIMPIDYLQLGMRSDEIEMRVLDLIAPVGLGQRALIVAPPRTGKTVLLQKIAKVLDDYYKEKIILGVLLVDERPEEVTDFMRTTKGMVFASSNDKPTKTHIRITEMTIGYFKRLAEAGHDVVLLVDSLTRLGRAYNAAQKGGGRTLSGGLDIRALEIPKKIFGSARKIENGGSLTIIATCLVETNSKMDDLIFEEFKGTGNMEVVLDRSLAENRIFPAINIAASGTRNEHKFLPDSVDERTMVRNYLLKKSPGESMTSLLQVLKRTDSNEELLRQIAAYS
jgi:transcription termination factor Rho